MLKQLTKLLKRALPKHDFLRGVSVLVGGTAAAQALTILVSPIKTRLFTPEDYGLVAVYGSLLAIIGIVANLRYEMAVPVAEDTREAAHLTVLGCGIAIGIAGITGFILFLFGDSIAAALNVPLLAQYFWLLPIGILLTGAFQVFKYWTLRAKQFGSVSKTTVQRLLVTVSIQLFGYKLGGLALLLGTTLGQGAGVFRLAKGALISPEFRKISWTGLLAVASRYRRFPLYSSWAGIFNTTGHQLPPLLLAYFFSAQITGTYNLAHHVLALPATMIGTAVANVFFPNAAEVYRAGKLGPLVANVHNKLAQIAMPPVLLIVVGGPDLFALAFGHEWRMAGEIARWLAPSLYMSFVSSSISTVFSTTGHQREGMLLQFLLLFVRVGSLLFGAFIFESVIATVAIYAGASAICYAIMLGFIAKYAGTPFQNFVFPTLSATGFAFLCALPLLASTLWSESTVLFIGALAIATILITSRLFILFRGYWAPKKS